MAKFNIIGWDDTSNWKNWSLTDFVAWHRGLVRHFGSQRNANGILLSDMYWLIFWAGSQGVNPRNMQILVATPSYFKEEVEYLKETSPKIYETSQIRTAVEFGKLSPVDVVYNALGTTVQSANDIISGFGTTVKILKYFIPIIGITALIFLMIWGYKTFVAS